MGEYSELRWQSTSALADAYVAVADALRSGRVCLGDVLEAWRYAEHLEEELLERGAIEERTGGGTMTVNEASERESILRDIEAMLGLLDLDQLRCFERVVQAYGEKRCHPEAAVSPPHGEPQAL